MKFKLIPSLSITQLLICSAGLCVAAEATASSPLPIADAHIHYSHDSVELTPPERVIEIMRDAGLKFALVSSSDDNGTQLLSDLAPDLIIPGLRPYRRRGELGSWFTDPAALEYVEKLLLTNRYATIGEFHLYGADVELEIPKRIVELADQYNLVLHAHSDAEAVERLLAQSDSVKVLWAHSGFDSPENIAAMLEKHDRLWADLAFRSEVGSGGSLSDDWIKLFTDYPDRMMLGTDTYTPERMYFIPDHAESARNWLTSLPADLAEKVAWKNAHDLLMPVWLANQKSQEAMKNQSNKSVSNNLEAVCNNTKPDAFKIESGDVSIVLQPTSPLKVSQPISIQMSLCGTTSTDTQLSLDAMMPAHGHGTNYTPEHTLVERSAEGLQYTVEGVVLHMPGKWQWRVDLKTGSTSETLVHDFSLQ